MSPSSASACEQCEANLELCQLEVGKLQAQLTVFRQAIRQLQARIRGLQKQLKEK